MRILIEPSDYSLFNVGDVAMMDVAMTRLHELWPDAIFEVMTDTSELLPNSTANVRYLSTGGRSRWLEEGYLSLKIRSRDIASPLGVQRIEDYLRRNRPGLVGHIKRLRSWFSGTPEEEMRYFLAAMQAADLLVVTGMGGITDVFEDYAFRLLNILGLAIHFGKATAMFSQGFGPIENSKLRARAREVLSRVDLIGLRENRASGPLLTSLGITGPRVITTGDDAIEEAFDRRVSALGTGLGVNVRCASYSGIERSSLEELRHLLLEAADVCGATIIPVPTSRHAAENDSSTLRLLFTGDVLSDYGENLNSPQKVIEQLQRCRILITGSYHAAVFALAQGIPVICMANSTYYADKFLGLMAQFVGGGEVIALQESGAGEKMRQSVLRLWASAQQIRPQLLESAKEQIKSGLSAYKEVHDLVCSRTRSATQRPEA